ncbi:hypothetical protein, partial [Alicyclobacillus macrosporangiidus]
MRHQELFILTGAGVSHPIVPMTIPLTSQLLDRLSSDKYVDSLYRTDQFYGSEHSQKRIVTGLIEIASELDLTFEDLIDGIDILATVTEGQQVSSLNPSIHTAVRILCGNLLSYRCVKPLFFRVLAHEVRKYILETVTLAVCEQSQEQLKEAPINRFLTRLRDEYRLRLITLNYDHLLDFSNIHFENGFTQSKSSSFTRYKKYDPLFEIRCMDHSDVCLSLHGSVHLSDRRYAVALNNWVLSGSNHLSSNRVGQNLSMRL